jgi:23S rRNA (guanosine2251-2'-O)-methyltransferase
MREILYGRNAVHESLLARRRRPYKLLLAEGVRQTDAIGQIVFLAEQQGVPVSRTERRNLDRIGDVNHQGVALETSEYPYVALDDVLTAARNEDGTPMFLLLDLLKDPQNVGSLLRTAEAAAVTGVLIQRRRAVDITPAVVNASAGAVEHLRVVQVTNLVDAIGRLKANDVWVAGLEATRGAQQYDQADLTGSLALVIGSEGEGLRRLVRERCDFLVQLPMHGRVTSLNAAVAGSIALYEARRQQGQHSTLQIE